MLIRSYSGLSEREYVEKFRQREMTPHATPRAYMLD